MWQSKTLVDGDRVRHAVARVEDDARRATRGVEAEDGLHGEEERRNVKRLEEDLCGLLAVPSRVERRLGQQDGVLLREGLQLVLAVDVLPDSLHVVPVGHNAVFHRVSDGEQAAMLLRLGAHEEIALESAGHHSRVLRPSDVVGEVTLGDLVAGKAGFDHT